MNTPNNLEWLTLLLHSLIPIEDIGTASVDAQVESVRNDIATKLSEAYKQGYIDYGLGKINAKLALDPTLTNDKEQE